MRLRQPATPVSDIVIQGILDTFDHPAWVCCSGHNMLHNELAKNVDVYAVNQCEPGVVVVKGARYLLTKKPLNHGTPFILYELTSFDDQTLRIRESSMKLEAALSKYE